MLCNIKMLMVKTWLLACSCQTWNMKLQAATRRPCPMAPQRSMMCCAQLDIRQKERWVARLQNPDDCWNCLWLMFGLWFLYVSFYDISIHLMTICLWSFMTCLWSLADHWLIKPWRDPFADFSWRHPGQDCPRGLCPDSRPTLSIRQRTRGCTGLDAKFKDTSTYTVRNHSMWNYAPPTPSLWG